MYLFGSESNHRVNSKSPSAEELPKGMQMNNWFDLPSIWANLWSLTKIKQKKNLVSGQTCHDFKNLWLDPVQFEWLDLADVDAHAPVDSAAQGAESYAEVDRRPFRVFRSTVGALLVARNLEN